MKKATVVLLLCGVVSLLWGSLLWADNTAAVQPPSAAQKPSAIQPPSKGLQGAVTNPSSVPNPNVLPLPSKARQSGPIRGSLFSKKPAGIPASLSREVFKVQPNPASGNVKITYRAQKPGQYEFTVLDANGHSVRRMVYPTPFAGLCRVIWDGKGDDGKWVAGGAYTLKMTSPDGVKTTQFSYSR